VVELFFFDVLVWLELLDGFELTLLFGASRPVVL
jgi:hypothetical protein